MDVSALKDQKKGIILQSQVCLTPSLYPLNPLGPFSFSCTLSALPLPPRTCAKTPLRPPGIHDGAAAPPYLLPPPCHPALRLPGHPCTLPALMPLLQVNKAVLSLYGLWKCFFSFPLRLVLSHQITTLIYLKVSPFSSINDIEIT